MFNMKRFFIIGLALAAAVIPAMAVDGGIGRTITGTWVIPGVAVVGPSPGPGLTVLPFGYQGAMGGSRLDPVSGVIVSNDEANANINVVILIRPISARSSPMHPTSPGEDRTIILHNDDSRCKRFLVPTGSQLRTTVRIEVRGALW